jgi:hypothetical protein
LSLELDQSSDEEEKMVEEARRKRRELLQKLTENSGGETVGVSNVDEQRLKVV